MPAAIEVPRVIVTRPQPQADTWVADLQGCGIDAAALPLIAIGPPADPQPVQQARDGLAALRMLVFVSPAAVAGFLDAAAITWPAGTLAAAPGPGTAQALRNHGVPEDCIVEPAADAGQFDSESLWAALGARPDAPGWRGQRVLLVGGSEGEQPSGRQWLAQQLREAGAKVEPLVAYRRTAAAIDDEGQALLRQVAADPRAHIWLFSSSEAIGHLEAAAGPALPRLREAALLATHPRIAERARAAGFVAIVDARPALDDIVATLRRAHHSREGGGDGPTPSIQSSAT
jgi:uroporphyrinogen-III synthase